MSPEKVSPTEVALSQGEYVTATNGSLIEGPQTVRIQEFGQDIVRVSGTEELGPHETAPKYWEVKAGNIEDFIAIVQKKR